MICSECHEDWPEDRFRPGRNATVCFRCRASTLRFEKLDERSVNVRNRDRKFAQDNAAYRRLRADGLQPRGVDNSAMAEKLADHKAEIELGRSATKEELRSYNRTLGPIR